MSFTEQANKILMTLDMDGYDLVDARNGTALFRHPSKEFKIFTQKELENRREAREKLGLEMAFREELTLNMLQSNGAVKSSPYGGMGLVPGGTNF